MFTWLAAVPDRTVTQFLALYTSFQARADTPRNETRSHGPRWTLEQRCRVERSQLLTGSTQGSIPRSLDVEARRLTLYEKTNKSVPRVRRSYKLVSVILKIHETDYSCHHERTVRRNHSKPLTNTQARLFPTHECVERVSVPYGERQSVVSHRPLARTASRSTASTALCRCSRPADDTVITVGGPGHKRFATACRPALAVPGIVRDQPIRGVAAAVVRRIARQPERRHHQVQPIATRRL